MQENMKRFLATAILVASQDGFEAIRELIAQAFASYVVSGDGMSRSELVENIISTQARTMNLIEADGNIWPELTPGGNQMNDLLPVLEKLAAEGVKQMSNEELDDRCSLCGERMSNVNRAEMYDPEDPLNSGLVHPSCGINAGWEIS